MPQTTPQLSTQEVRRLYQQLRDIWQRSNSHNPFLFTTMLTEDMSIEEFCIHQLLQKYMN